MVHFKLARVIRKSGVVSACRRARPLSAADCSSSRGETRVLRSRCFVEFGLAQGSEVEPRITIAGAARSLKGLGPRDEFGDDPVINRCVASGSVAGLGACSSPGSAEYVDPWQLRSWLKLSHPDHMIDFPWNLSMWLHTPLHDFANDMDPTIASSVSRFGDKFGDKLSDNLSES